jgi:hypothetical protein
LALRMCRIENRVHLKSSSTDPVEHFLRSIEKARALPGDYRRDDHAGARGD